jgi:DNA-binding XRE family transcriptional regulator
MTKQRNSVGVREQAQLKVTSEQARRRESNHVQELREEQLLSKAELARRAGVSALTVDRIERGESCRLDTKRKIILALGLKVADKDRVFPKGKP